MRCHQCHGNMQQTDCVDDRGVRQTWYDCPVCAAHHTVVQPCENRIYRLGKLLRCSCGWSDAALRYEGVR